MSGENEQLSQRLDPQEVGSLARSSSRTKGAAGNCWREHFKKVRNDEQLRTVSERAGFVRSVSKGMYYKTDEDVDDGFGSFASCRENTFFRTQPASGAKLWIYKYTEIGPVLDVKVICHHNVHGIEIQISTSGDNQSLGGHVQKLKSLRG